jgi:hypothetical protein
MSENPSTTTDPVTGIVPVVSTEHQPTDTPVGQNELAGEGLAVEVVS